MTIESLEAYCVRKKKTAKLDQTLKLGMIQNDTCFTFFTLCNE